MTIQPILPAPATCPATFAFPGQKLQPVVCPSRPYAHSKRRALRRLSASILGEHRRGSDFWPAELSSRQVFWRQMYTARPKMSKICVDEQTDLCRFPRQLTGVKNAASCSPAVSLSHAPKFRYAQPTPANPARRVRGCFTGIWQMQLRARDALRNCTDACWSLTLVPAAQAGHVQDSLSHRCLRASLQSPFFHETPPFTLPSRHATPA